MIQILLTKVKLSKCYKIVIFVIKMCLDSSSFWRSKRSDINNSANRNWIGMEWTAARNHGWFLKMYCLVQLRRLLSEWLNNCYHQTKLCSFSHNRNLPLATEETMVAIVQDGLVDN